MLCGMYTCLSGTSFCFLPKELLRCHTPMNGNIVAVILPDLNPVNQLGDHQMLGFVACIVKAAGPAQDLVHLDFVCLLVVLLHFQQDFGFFLLSLRVIGTHSSISK